MFHDGRYLDAGMYATSAGGPCGVMSLPRQLQIHQQYVHQQQQQQLLQYPPQQFGFRTLINNGYDAKDRNLVRPAKCQPLTVRGGHLQDGSTAGRPVGGRRDAGAGSSCCCVPTGCTRYADDLIDPVDPGDAVRVMCNNPGCTVGRWMHADCYEEWDRRANYYMRWYDQETSCRFNHMAAASASRLVLAGQLRMCICGKGLLSKDPNYVSPTFTNAKKITAQQSSQLTNQPDSATGTELATGLVRHLQQLHLQQEQQQQRMRSCSFSSTGSGSCSSGSSSSVGGGSSSCGYSSTSATPPLSPPRSFFPSSTTLAASPPPPVAMATRVATGRGSSSIGDDSGVASNVSVLGAQQQLPPPPSHVRPHNHRHHHHHHQHDVVADVPAATGVDPSVGDKPQPNARGNIFRHRADLSVYRAIRPSVRNAYCIQLDDDGPHGNNDTRKFLMHKLTASGVAAFQCVSCRRSLPVYDEFPVVDGTLFLSPRSYDATDGRSTSASGRLSVQVVYNRRMLSLHAVCVDCMGQTVGSSDSTAAAAAAGCGSTGHEPRPKCRSCRRPWSLGSTLVLGTMYAYDVFACAPCCADRQRCRRCGQRPAGGDEPRLFSDFSKLSTCVHCGLEDYHYVRPFDDSFYCCHDDVGEAAAAAAVASVPTTSASAFVPKVLQRQS